MFFTQEQQEHESVKQYTFQPKKTAANCKVANLFVIVTNARIISGIRER